MRFIIDHMAKPGARTIEEQSWFDDIKEAAKSSQNVFCKLSG
jgi:predicted TIM-barrel fold metal-dependent hydrolase